MSYRKKYETETGEDIPKSFDVHHIDKDRSNDRIRNLVAIPEELHNELHKALNILPDSINIKNDFQSVIFPQTFELIISYKQIFYMLTRYIDLRNYFYMKKNDKPLAFSGYISILEDYNYKKLELELKQQLNING